MAQFLDVYGRVWGDGDITNLIEVTALNNMAIFEMSDSTEYSIGVPNGLYGFNSIARRADIVDEFNRQLEAAGVPIKCTVGGVRGENRAHYNCMVFQSKDETNPIETIIGSFLDLFMDQTK